MGFLGRVEFFRGLVSSLVGKNEKKSYTTCSQSLAGFETFEAHHYHGICAGSSPLCLHLRSPNPLVLTARQGWKRLKRTISKSIRIRGLQNPNPKRLNPKPYGLPLCLHLQLPTVYNYKECVETDGQFFWSGAPWVSPSQFRSCSYTTCLL